MYISYISVFLSAKLRSEVYMRNFEMKNEINSKTCMTKISEMGCFVMF